MNEDGEDQEVSREDAEADLGDMIRKQEIEEEFLNA